MIARALLVGINKYRTDNAEVNNLKGCLNDVELVAHALQSRFDCPSDRILTLTDDRATGANLRREFLALVNDLAAHERIFFYYSGHGIRVPDFDGDEEEDEPDFPWEVAGAWDEAIVTHDFSKTQPFLDDEIRALRSQVPAHAKITMILDCCHSGGMPRASGIYVPGRVDPEPVPRGVGELSRDLFSPDDQQQLTQHKRSFITEAVDENFVALAACQDDEKAWEQWIDGKRQGLFTYAICKCLADRDASVTVHELMTHAQDFINEQAAYRQTPRLVGNPRFYDVGLFD